MPIRDDQPMMDRRANQEWLDHGYPKRVFARNMALMAWWGFLWQRRNREDA